MDAQLFRFTIGEYGRGFSSPLLRDRVGLNFISVGGPSINLTMSSGEARAVANALYEAADAAEKMPTASPAKAVA